MSQLGLGMTRDEEVDEGRRPRRRGSYRAVIVAFVALLAMVGVVAFAGIHWITAGDDFSGDGTGSVTVVVHPGDALRTIGSTLAAAGVVKSGDAFVTAADDQPKASSISAGTYVLRRGMSGAAAVALMLDPSSRTVGKLVIPEGLRMSQVVTAAAKATGLSQDDLRASLAKAGLLGLPTYANGNPEGYLFPATYQFAKGVSADQVVTTMLQRFDKAALDSDLTTRAQSMGMTPAQVVVVASILEVEAAPADYNKVARVIYNRLAQGKALQLDSTVNYGLGTADLHLSQAQLKTDTPYNTYLHKGLPSGAIDSPGDAAIEAALDPAPGNWMYFITTDVKNKVTKFTSSYAQFLLWKAEFQKSSG
ncbi:MAG TPA: endolytic transglycosylase MltG [Candidatus Nanopelagicales bacterium]|jgi:UPF0755 protein